LKQQQIQEEIRRTELYTALMKGYTQPPSILPTVTKIEVDKEIGSEAFQFPKRPPHLRATNYYKESEERDILDHLLTNTKMLDLRIKPEKLVETIDTRPESSGSQFDPTTSGLKYLGYFNTPDLHQAIRIDDSSKRFNLPDEDDDLHTKFYIPEDSNSVAGILRRNNQRLDALDEIEHTEFKRYENDLFTSPPSNYAHENNRYEEEKTSKYDIVDDLLEKINNPRKYLYD
jgi:hypothetical protein